VGRVQFDPLHGSRDQLLRRAFGKFQPNADFSRFQAENQGWLRDYALFSAVKQESGGAPWWDWAPGLRLREAPALADARKRLAGEIRYQEFLQYQFSRQWSSLREYARGRGIGVIGDLPIYVAHDSADVWAHQDFFELDSRGRPIRVAGAPPDGFNPEGQRWGNPLYRWDLLKARGYDWWIDRLKFSLQRFDAVRLDHFIGFERYWAIPADAPTAKTGKWQPGPSADFFRKIQQTIGTSRIIAEDLGAVTPEVHALRDRFGLPGMRVLQFAFSGTPSSDYHLPKNAPSNSIFYTGTHDNNTTRGWFLEASGPERNRVLRAVGTSGSEIHWDLIRLAQSSPANLVIVPAQDLLGLDSSGRMNAPGIANGNWSWRVGPRELSSVVASRLRKLGETHGRIAPPSAFDRTRSVVATSAQGLATFAMAYMLKEALQALEHRDLAHWKDAVRAMGTKEWWIGLVAFSISAHVVERGLNTFGAGELSRAVLPLAAGMAAVQLLSGRVSGRDLAISTGSFVVAGTVMSFLADGLLYPALFSSGPPGWIAVTLYSVVKLGVTLYLGEKLEGWIHEWMRASHRSREGVRQKVEAIGR